MSEETSKPSYYAIIPAKVRYDPELRPNAKLLYAEITALANAEGYCWMQNEGFGKLFGLATKSVSSLISQLADKGYIEVEVMRDPETKAVIQRRLWVDTPPHRKKEDTPSPQENGDPPPAKEETPPPKKTEENNTSKVFNKPPISPKGDVTQEVLFDRFWKAYPRHTAKDKAQKAWKKLKPDIVLCQVMAAALEVQKASEAWTHDGGKYIPHAATWLNGRRWEDEVAVDSQPSAVPEAPRASHIEHIDGEEVVVFD